MLGSLSTSSVVLVAGRVSDILPNIIIDYCYMKISKPTDSCKGVTFQPTSGKIVHDKIEQRGDSTVTVFTGHPRCKAGQIRSIFGK